MGLWGMWEGDGGLSRARVCFFFQAEDGIRFRDVTGVQTCALPILTCTISNFNLIGDHVKSSS